MLFVENCDENKEFTLSWLMDELVDRNGVSPSKVFGLDYEEMKSALMGLSQKYPDFIIASFTNDLDKISILQKNLKMLFRCLRRKCNVNTRSWKVQTVLM